MTQLDPARVPLTGLSLIEASAGTGKTHTITTLVLRLLLEQQLDVRGILVLTYTKAATAELRERIRARIAELLRAIEREHEPREDAALQALWTERRPHRAADVLRLQGALRDFDEAAIFTIHGFCQRVLGERALESRTAFDVELAEDMSALVEEVAVDLWEHATWQHEPRVLRELRNKGLSIDEVRKVVAMAVHEPALPIVPPLGARPPVPSTLAVEAARRELAQVWAGERAAVLAIVGNGTFNQNSHRIDRVRDTYAPAIDTVKDGVTNHNIAMVRKFTPSAVEKAMTKRARPPRHPFFDACGMLDAAYRDFEEAAEALVRHELGVIARRARELIDARKRERGVQSFEDLLGGLAKALEVKSGDALARHVAQRYPALLVDEFQDTDPLQYGIFMRLYAGGMKTMLLIGDPKQAIYGFRGADVYAYMRAVRDVGERVLRLGVNHRSDPALVYAVNTLFDQPQSFEIEGLQYQPVSPKPGARERLVTPGPALDILFVSREDQARKAGGDERALSSATIDALPGMVASDIVRLLGAGATIDGEPVVPQDIAVLCRTNRQGQEVQQALSALGVPVALDGDSSVFKSQTAEELCRVLSAMASPSDLRAVKSGLATALLGCSAEDLLALEQDEARLATWLAQLMRAHVRWLERGFVQAIHGLFIDARVHERLLSRRDGQRRLTDALHLIELLHIEATREHLGPLALVRRLEGIRNDIDVSSGLAAESAQLRLESDEHAVRVTTVHRSKGLQYPIVYCPYLWFMWAPTPKTAVRFHDEEHTATIDVLSAEFEAHKELAGVEDDAEALRLTYVALTRAKHRCCVVWGGFPKAEKTALGRLLGVDDGSDRALCSALDGWRERSDGAIGWRVLPPARDVRYRAPVERTAQLSARRLTRALPLGERLTSFSRIAKHAPRENAELIAEGQDRDAVPAEPLPAAGTMAPDAAPVTLATFPAGPSAGTLVHAIYERIDFQRADPEELPTHTRAALVQGQLEVEPHADMLVRGIAQSLLTPIPVAGASFTLSSIAPGDRINELEFMLEIERGSAFSSAAIAEALVQHGPPAGAPEYAARVRELRQGAVEGFLRGFVDLVLRHEGRFYVVDYKSNHLGELAAHYTQPALRGAMQEHHYYLQAYLYTVALHRYLASRLPGYDYDRHIGGYAYLFLRGMAPEHPLGTGVLAERPPRALIERLSEQLRRQKGAAA